jgi:K+-transporting ATPase KdpF subunit
METGIQILAAVLGMASFLYLLVAIVRPERF